LEKFKEEMGRTKSTLYKGKNYKKIKNKKIKNKKIKKVLSKVGELKSFGATGYMCILILFAFFVFLILYFFIKLK
jgi:hypothetical protein